MTRNGEVLLRELLRELETEFAGFRLVYKAGDRLSRAIHLGLLALTFGGQRRYLSHYHTVLGKRVYVPASWDATPAIDKVITLRHERVHLRQRRRYTFLGMAFLYVIPMLPVGLAYGRALLEWEAYTETLRATWELKGEAAARSEALREHIVARFVGPDYAWMWPFRGHVNRWYDRALEQLAREMGSVS